MEWKLLCGYLNGQYYIIIRHEKVCGGPNWLGQSEIGF